MEADDLKERIRAHYRDQGRRRIEVEQWGDGKHPAVIFAEPPNMKLKRRLAQRSARAGPADADLFMLIDILILCAQNEQGEPYFTVEDRRWLETEADPDIIADVANKIMRADRAIEDYLANFSQTASD